jgi:hypothetical protein
LVVVLLFFVFWSLCLGSLSFGSCIVALWLLVVVTKDKEQQYKDQKTKNNKTTTERQRTTIHRPKDKEQQYSD